MNYDGEKFLLKLYQDMYKDESVRHSSTKSDNKYEVVKKYIERLEKVHEKAMNHKTDTGVNLLKDFYYDKYVIKKDDIPESYMEYLDKVQFDQYGVHMGNSQRKEQKDLIIQDQKKSLDEWIDYFTSEDSKFYPTWAKYWAFQGMLTIGNYDTNKGIYNKRSKTTVAPFPELDREVLSKSIDLIIKEVNKEEIEDKDLEQLVKNGNFFKLYTVQLKDKRESNFGEETKGEWIKYEQGDNYQKLHQSLQGKNTGWCTAGEETCRNQVKNGDFYVYYTYDEKGKATNPRLAIRMDGKNRIGEIRGVAKDQNIEPHFEDILSKKLKGFPDAESYQKRVKDTQMLTYVYTKYENHKPLTKEDIKFIYEIDDKIKTMGWDIDPRLKEMKKNIKERKIKDVLSKDEIIELVKKNHLILTFIPKEMIDKKVALEVVKQNEYATLEFIPKEIIDKEIALELVKQYTTALHYVPEEIIDKEIALEAVKKCGGELVSVPEALRSKEICIEAVKQEGKSLEYVPKALRNKEMCLKAVKQNWEAIEFVPDNLRDKDIILEVVKQNGRFLYYNFSSLEEAENSIDSEDDPKMSISYSFMNKRQKYGYSEERIDKKICIEAVKQTGTALQYVPKNIIDKEICIEAVKQSWNALQYVPEDIMDKEICLEAVKHNGYALQYVPENIIDKEICLEAVKQHWYALEYVPENIIDKELCLLSIKQHEDFGFPYHTPKEVREEVKQELEKMKNNDEDTVQVLEDSDSKIR